MIHLLIGAGFGAGAWWAFLGWRPPLPALADALTPRAPAPATTPRPASADGWSARIGDRFVPLLGRRHLPGRKTRADLLALSVPVERHLAEKAGAAVAGLLIPWLMALLTAFAGARFTLLLPAWTSVALAGALFLAPDLAVRRRAAAYRSEVRQALSTLLELTVVALSGGAGVEQALTDAAGAGHGAAFTAFRRALREAELTRTAPWGPLGELGERLGVAELVELAATTSLAGHEGARIKTSLTSKAATVRAHLLAEAEAEAASATERMSLPVVVLFAGFLLFIGYPALTHALAGL
ncbi:type II secretion system F family protein [Kitasatospora sp. NBC_01287]|uniref:type II secretion system F family protein n=1 Tax=Kitasatospora sp. NBC_01287 TaxID=2903573 RepID=UPI00224FCAFE|nr:type II secretion system F family protein [Kitasatospora sp. NBC_01287]MCX4750573.1 type II secretion system F family protein [Kitasatospora sp. NBC_01287]